ncbi:MAG: cation transporter [Leptospirales bacterium]|nr:cation transporter [Leptospirales bacterium]
MLVLMRAKRRTGQKLNSPAIIADAECTKVCVYMSVILLVASGLYMLVQIPHLDTLGSLALHIFLLRRGRNVLRSRGI